MKSPEGGAGPVDLKRLEPKLAKMSPLEIRFRKLGGLGKTVLKWRPRRPGRPGWAAAGMPGLAMAGIAVQRRGRARSSRKESTFKHIRTHSDKEDPCGEVLQHFGMVDPWWIRGGSSVEPWWIRVYFWWILLLVRSIAMCFCYFELRKLPSN